MLNVPAMRGLGNVPWTFAFSGVTTACDSAATSANVTASSTAHTKGSWAQLVASTSDDIGLLGINVQSLSGNGVDNRTLLDLAVGPSGSEVAFLSNLAIGGAVAAGGIETGLTMMLPISIASGSRIAARIQSANVSRATIVNVYGMKVRSHRVMPASVSVLGTDTTTSSGTVMSGSSNTWVEIAASTGSRFRALMLVPSQGGTTMGTVRPEFDIGYGASGAEVSLGTVKAQFGGSESAASPIACPIVPLGCDLPAGTRIAVRHRIASNPGQYAVSVIGIPA